MVCLTGIFGVVMPNTIGISFYPHYKHLFNIYGNFGVIFLSQAYGLLLIVVGISQYYVFYGGNIASMNGLLIGLTVGDILHIYSAIMYWYKHKFDRYIMILMSHVGTSIFLFVMRMIFLSKYYEPLSWSEI